MVVGFYKLTHINTSLKRLEDAAAALLAALSRCLTMRQIRTH